MKRTIGIFSLFLFVATASDAAGTWHKKVEDARKAAEPEGRLIFVDMFAQWCGWCHRFDREIVPSEAFQNATRDMVLLRVDTEDRGEGTALSNRFNVTKLPTFVILTPDLSLAGVIQGYAPAEQFAELVNAKVAEHQAFSKLVESKKRQKPEDELAIIEGLVARQRFAEAETRARALSKNPKAPPPIVQEGQYLAAVSLSSTGKEEEALDAAAALIGKSPKSSAAERASLLRAQIFLKHANYQAALTEYRSFKAKFPESRHIQTANYFIPQLESAIARMSADR